MSGRDDEFIAWLSKISDKSDQTKDHLVALDKKLDLHIQATNNELAAIKELDAIQNQQLAEHIEGVKTLKKIHDLHVKDNEDRFLKLEAPRKWFKQTAKILLTLGAIAAAVTGIFELLKFFK